MAEGGKIFVAHQEEIVKSQNIVESIRFDSKSTFWRVAYEWICFLRCCSVHIGAETVERGVLYVIVIVVADVAV